MSWLEALVLGLIQGATEFIPVSSSGHLTLIPQLKDELEKLGRGDILIVVGGVIPPQDYEALHEAGAAFIFGPGTNIPEAAIQLVESLTKRVKG